ncbi:hypothetical protein MRB53_041089 [Persea americana]|nr:hypothetical protein MRB53_041089 [Persea americana]
MFRNNYDNDSVTLYVILPRIEALFYCARLMIAALPKDAYSRLTQRRRALLLPEEDHPHRQPLWRRSRGLASDARVLSNYMKQQSLASRLTIARAIPLSNIVSKIASRAQHNTQAYGRRPYGVGLLVGGADASGTHLYEFMPSGMTQEMVADAIGARSQMARTYLERNLEHFEACGKDELVKHALLALRESMPNDKELNTDNTSVGVGGVGEVFKLVEGEHVRGWLEAAFSTAESAPAGESETAAETSTTAAADSEESRPAGESMDVDT